MRVATAPGSALTRARARVRDLLKARTRLRRIAASRMRIDNYVAIRFSLRMKAEWSAKAYGDESGRADWFARRAELFSATAAASLQNQTVPPRRVLVCMDPTDEGLWRRHLDLPAPFVPVFVATESLASAIAAQVRGDRARDVVISRLDSDDAVGDDYLEQVNATARDARRAGRAVSWIVACQGFVTDLERIQELYYSCSPFISVYARRYAGEAVYDVEHERVLELDPLLNTSARWLQVVHGSNIANRLRTRSRFAPGDRRRMRLGPIRPVESGWPSGFPSLPDVRRSVGPRQLGTDGGAGASS